MNSDQLNYLNIGCGLRFKSNWINVDMTSSSPHVRAHNILDRIPFGDDTFDLVYHSHVLEHFTKDDAISVMKECYRVLKPGGVVRVVVPDLEQIIQEYINIVQRAKNNKEGWEDDYDWIMLELYDQTIRNSSGGKMLNFLRQERIPNELFVKNRISPKEFSLSRNTNIDSKQNKNPFFYRLFARLRHIISNTGNKSQQLFLGSKNHNALRLGQFRLEGEIHQWMYDKYSLGKLLREIGFTEIREQNAYDSKIENWSKFNLDTDSDGSVHKPISLYIEAMKNKN